MVEQPKVDNLLHISWCDSMWVPHLNAGNVLDYFSERSNPFYSRDCNNEFIKMQQNTRIDALTQMQGTEYMLLHAQDPILYIVRKQQRYSPNHATPLASYHIIAGQVFQTPDIGTVLNSRLASALSHISGSFSELSSYSQYHPSKGYWWHFHNKTQQQLDQQNTSKENKDKKLSVKEEAATMFQRRRVEALLQDITTRFPYKQPVAPPPPAATDAQDPGAASAGAAAAAPATAAAAAGTTQGVTTGNNNSGVVTAPSSVAGVTSNMNVTSPPLNIKTEDIKQEERPDSRPDIKLEVKQELKTEIKTEPQSLPQQQQHFQRSTKAPPEKRQRLN
uniref:Mediator of RNA polymerase II transcription subunit 6 n=1 Tax=Hirondellea gigas TaxID=1518452 RepID=A0A2P2HWW8_9CRUS